MFLAQITYIFCITLFITECKSDCVSSVNSFKNILVVDSNNNIEYSNDGRGNIVKKECESITLACPGSVLNIKKDRNRESFLCCDDSYEYNVEWITCSATLISRERRLGNCSGGYYHLEIGYQFPGYRGDFIPHIDLCWDDVKKRTLWAHVTLQKYLGECSVQSSRPLFRSGNYFPSSLSKYYTQKEQLITLLTLFQRIPPQIKTTNLLETGHLVAKCDFIYDAQRRLTFHYTNAAPQWKSFNGPGKWGQLEANIRKLIRKENTELEVYTGTFGILQIEGKDFYLSSQTSQIPVPKYFWKVVIKKRRFSFQTLGVAIVGYNDIFSNYSPDLCTDIMDSIHWLNIPRAKERSTGYMIACTIFDFVNIPGLKDELPNFPNVYGILTGYRDDLK